MLTLPAFQDRLVVLAAGLLMALGLAYVFNKLRARSERKSVGDIEKS